MPTILLTSWSLFISPLFESNLKRFQFKWTFQIKGTELKSFSVIINVPVCSTHSPKANMSFSARNNSALCFIIKQFGSQSFCVNAFHFVNWSIAVTKRLNNGRRRCCLFRKIGIVFNHFVLNSYSIFSVKGKNQQNRFEHFSSQRLCQRRNSVKTVGVLLMLFLFPFTVFPFSIIGFFSWIPFGMIRSAKRPFLIGLVFGKNHKITWKRVPMI